MLKENDNIYHPTVLKTTHGLMLSQPISIKEIQVLNKIQDMSSLEFEHNVLIIQTNFTSHTKYLPHIFHKRSAL